MTLAAVFVVATTAGAVRNAHADPRITIESVNDSSPSTTLERDRTTATLRRALDRIVRAHAGDACAHVDATIVSLTVEPGDTTVAVTAQLRLAVSDDSGRIVSMLTGGARVEIPAHRYRARALPGMREDAVAAAVEGMQPKLELAFASTTPARAMTPWLRKLVGNVAATGTIPRS